MGVGRVVGGVKGGGGESVGEWRRWGGGGQVVVEVGGERGGGVESGGWSKGGG